ncbi:hypothetical protein ABPG72_004153 [Tetrahymena utriculariae]
MTDIYKYQIIQIKGKTIIIRFKSAKQTGLAMKKKTDFGQICFLISKQLKDREFFYHWDYEQEEDANLFSDIVEDWELVDAIKINDDVNQQFIPSNDQYWDTEAVYKINFSKEEYINFLQEGEVAYDIDITAQGSSQVNKQNRENTKGSGEEDDSQQNNCLDNNSVIIFNPNSKEEQNNQPKQMPLQNYNMISSQYTSQQTRAVAAQTQPQFKNQSLDKQSEITLIKSEIESSFQNREKVFINKRNLSHSRRLMPFEQKATIQSSIFVANHIIHIVGKAGNLYQLFKLMLNCILLCHIIPILYYQLAVVEQTYFQVTYTWIDTIQLSNYQLYDLCIFALFSSLNIIMLNTQSALNTLETAFVILVMYSTKCSFAFIMQCISNIYLKIVKNFLKYSLQNNYFGDILEQKNKKTREFKSGLDTINQYLRKKNFLNNLQSKVCNFLEYLYEEKGDIKNNKEALSVLKRLSVSLREDIQQDINQNVIEQFQSNCKTFSDKIKKKTIQIIQEECFLPNEIIFKQGSFTNQALYLVQRGKILFEKVKTNGEVVTFCQLEKKWYIW